jgi:hypothetical protein
MDVVWKKMVDNSWKAVVTRETKNYGLLTIQNMKTNFEKKFKVNLSFNAEPNPEIEDILLWEELLDEAIKKA